MAADRMAEVLLLLLRVLLLLLRVLLLLRALLLVRVRGLSLKGRSRRWKAPVRESSLRRCLLLLVSKWVSKWFIFVLAEHFILLFIPEQLR